MLKLKKINYQSLIRHPKKILTEVVSGEVIYKVSGLPNFFSKNSPLKNLETLLSIDEKEFQNLIDKLEENQFIQRKMFKAFPKEILDNFFIDGFVRFRRTSGEGAFVGPHLDVYEGLPNNSINFWITFTNLERNESLQFYDRSIYPNNENLGGAFKPYCILKNGKLMPTKKLLENNYNFSINAFECFLFNSARIVHSSPFFLKKVRLTLDQRIFMDEENLIKVFSSRKNYYKGKALRTIKNGNLYNYMNRFSIDEHQLQNYINETPISKIKKIKLLDTAELIKFFKYETKVRSKYVEEEIKRNPQSINIYLSSIRYFSNKSKKLELTKLLLKLKAENPPKVLKKISELLSYDILITGLLKHKMFIFLAIMIGKLLSNLGLIFNIFKKVTLRYFSFIGKFIVN